MLDWLQNAYLGIKRKDATRLDYCRFPIWFIRWYAKPKYNALAIMYALGKALDIGTDDDEVDNNNFSW